MTQVPSPAERLRAVRDALGCTWTALAEAFGICTRSLEHYRSGARAMPRRVGHCVARLEIRLGLPCSDPPLVLFAEFAPAVRELEAAVTARLEPLLTEMEARRKASEEALDRLVARSEARRKAKAEAEAAKDARRSARELARAEAEAAKDARRLARERARAEAEAAKEARRKARERAKAEAREEAEAAKEARRKARERARAKAAAARRVVREAGRIARAEAKEALDRARAAEASPQAAAALEAFKWELRNRGGSFTQWCGRVGVATQTAERALTRPLWPGEKAARIRAAAAATLRDMGGGL